MFLFKEIGPIMRKARKKNKLTIKEVSEITGLNADTISDLENQKTNMKIFGLLDHLVHLYKLDQVSSKDAPLFSFDIFAGLSEEAIADIMAIIERDHRRKEAAMLASQDVTPE